MTFRINAPKASDVSVGGDFGAGGKLLKDENGIWTVTVGPLVADQYSYTFTVDGVRTLDPRNPQIKQGNDSNENIVFIKGDDSRFEDNNAVAHGQVREVWYQSKTLESQRRMHVYTPAGYDASPGERYPVLYLLHGGGDEDSGWSTIGRAGFIVDNLIAERKARPMVSRLRVKRIL